MSRFLGPPGDVIKFICLLLAILLTAATVANMLFGKPWLALASAVVAAWAVMVYVDTLRAPRE